MGAKVTTYEEVKAKLKAHPHTWLITGVAGFIGSNLLETLLNLNQKVIGLDNFSTGSQANLDDVLHALDEKKSANFTFHEGDICSLEDCQKVMQGVDIVLHQAALGSVPRSIRTPELTNATNITGFMNVLLAAKDCNIKRFIYASSSSVYGDSPVLPKKEEDRGNPLSPYAVTKYTNELYARAFSTCYGIKTIGLRYFNVFGPRQSPKGAYAAVIPLWIAALLNNQPVYINGDGETSRDFCFIDNAVQANILAAMVENSMALDQVYNITFGKPTTLKELYGYLTRLLDKKEQQPIYRAFRTGDIRHSLADISRAENFLKYNPKHQVEQGLQQTIHWFVKNNQSPTL